MNGNTSALKKRIENIWQPPDFKTFFQTYSKRPPQVIKKGTLLFNAGDQLERLYYIQEGFVKLYRLSEEGRETTIYLYGPGYVLGIRALTSEDKSAWHNAEAITQAKILTLSHKDYFEIVTNHPEHLLDLTHIFIDRLNYTERKLEGFITTDATARVAHFLYDCVRRFCPMPEISNKKHIVLPLDLTHQRIAEFVGSFRETVTVAIKRLEEDKTLTINRGKITILNLKQLKDHALLQKDF